MNCSAVGGVRELEGGRVGGWVVRRRRTGAQAVERRAASQRPRRGPPQHLPVCRGAVAVFGVCTLDKGRDSFHSCSRPLCRVTSRRRVSGGRGVTDPTREGRGTSTRPSRRAGRRRSAIELGRSSPVSLDHSIRLDKPTNDIYLRHPRLHSQRLGPPRPRPSATPTLGRSAAVNVRARGLAPSLLSHQPSP